MLMANGRILMAILMSVDLTRVVYAEEKIPCTPGEEREIGIMRYKCLDDGVNVEPIGCLTSDGQKLSFDQTATVDNFVVKCELLENNVVQLTPEKCVYDKKEIESTAIGDFFYECKKTKTGMALELVACRDNTGATIPFNTEFNEGPFTFKCQVEGTNVQKKGITCNVEGKTVSLKHKYRDNYFMYRCTEFEKGGIQKEALGCLTESMEIIPLGNKFVQDKFEYTCAHKTFSDGDYLIRTITGCVVTQADNVNKVYNFGETWTHQLSNPDHKYLMECKGGAEKAEQIPSKCIAAIDGKDKEMEIGCVTARSNLQYVTCEEEAKGTLKMRLLTYKNPKTADAVAKKFGLKVC